MSTYDRDRIGFLQRAHRDYGDCFAFDDRTIVVADPAMVHDVLGRTNADFLAEGALYSNHFDPVEMSAGVEDWMTARALPVGRQPLINLGGR